jgi:mRNA m6A methyltransferase non-catalytic subunit
LQATSEHCLMGIKGTVRRSTDGHLIHANVDTDVIVSETPPLANTKKPEELYDMIERFAMGRRRLELFGHDHNIRPGWVTLGNQLTTSNWDRERYGAYFREGHGHLLEVSDKIEKLRPKSPPRKGTHKPTRMRPLTSARMHTRSALVPDALC